MARTGIVLLVGMIGLTGCRSQADSGSSTPAGNTRSPGSVALSSELDHIHGASFDFGDGSVLTATHHGLWRVALGGSVTKVGSSSDDFMGFTIPMADRWLASGHPEPSGSAVNPLGLIASTDQGRTWASVSRRGETDFHALAAKGSTVVGFDGHSGLIQSRDGGRTWVVAAPLRVAALAFTGDRLLAVTANGVEASVDMGASFRPVDGSPSAVLLSTTGATVWVIDRSNRAWLSTDAGATWAPRSQVSTDVSALAAVDSTRAYAITSRELVTVE